MKLPLAVLAALAALLLTACGSSVTTQVVAVQTPLPERERAVYRVQDKDGAEIGSAVFQIEPNQQGLALTQDYTFGEAQRDRSLVVVDRDSMRPRIGERLVDDNGATYRTAMTYTPEEVTVVFTGERGDRTRSADIPETAYDNLESLFLWRTLEMGAGFTVSYVNVVVDPKRGTISRALAKVEVSGREEVRLADGAVVEAWRVDFTSAGVTNQAWYAVSPDRRLVKYVIARGPTLVLESATP